MSKHEKKIMARFEPGRKTSMKTEECKIKSDENRKDLVESYFQHLFTRHTVQIDGMNIYILSKQQ